MEAWTDLYLELTRRIAGTYIIKDAVEDVSDLETSYPNPEENWAAKVKSSGYIYLYYDNQWNNTKLRKYILRDIKWVDLWRGQINRFTKEVPFSTPALFIAFNTKNCKNLGQLIQVCNVQFDFYLYYDVSSDTYSGSFNQESAIESLHLLTDLFTCFHGVSGCNFQTLSRANMHCKYKHTGDSGNLYRISFTGNIEDTCAQKEFEEKEVTEIKIKNEEISEIPNDDAPLFILPT